MPHQGRVMEGFAGPSPPLQGASLPLLLPSPSRELAPPAAALGTSFSPPPSRVSQQAHIALRPLSRAMPSGLSFGAEGEDAQS